MPRAACAGNFTRASMRLPCIPVSSQRCYMLRNHDFEFYETPEPVILWLDRWLTSHGWPINGHCFEPCVGNGAIVRALQHESRAWRMSDLDPRWCETPRDARDERTWADHGAQDWTITNPPFSQAMRILTRAFDFSLNVAMYLRLSIHEPLRTGLRRDFLHRYRPSAVLMLPRFAHQRSRKKGIWSTDSVTSCWCIWRTGASDQFIDYAPPDVTDALDAFTPGYRDRMDALMGFSGSETERQRQCIEQWKCLAV